MNNALKAQYESLPSYTQIPAMLKIESKIVGIEIEPEAPSAVTAVSGAQTTFLEPPAEAESHHSANVDAKPAPRLDPVELELMSEHIERQEEMFGSTYKIKPPTLDHALYITINDIILNEGTTHEVRRPFEIFINSKNMEHFEWIVALTRLISAVFRKGGNLEFIVEELKSVFAPQGGYFKSGSGGVYMNSVVAEIGWIIERHMTKIGLIAPTRPDEHLQKLIDDKSEQLSDRGDTFSERAQICRKCNTKTVVYMDGCLTCLNCGDSKCE